MSRNLYFYTRLAVKDLQTIVFDFQEKFEESLQDTFSDDELAVFEKQLDSMAAIFVQPILSELSFDDFYPDPKRVNEQWQFFLDCKSSISIENLPFMESNPFQVSYLKDFLGRLDEVLIDSGGVSELQFKNDYLKKLSLLKDMSSIVPQTYVPKIQPRTSAPVHPIDFLVRDVYVEMDLIQKNGLRESVLEELQSMSENFKKIDGVFQETGLDSETLMLRSKLNPKDFGDQLERMKFFLRRINGK